MEVVAHKMVRSLLVVVLGLLVDIDIVAGAVYNLVVYLVVVQNSHLDLDDHYSVWFPDLISHLYVSKKTKRHLRPLRAERKTKMQLDLRSNH